MPTYDYLCKTCGPFSAFRAMAESGEPMACEECGEAAERAYLSAPQFLGMEPSRRAAIATNEKSRHEPRLSSNGDRAAKAHGAGCGCCKPSKSKRGLLTATGSKAFPSARPWMISH